MIKSYKIQVSGKVQGVSFRIKANREASALGLTGYVQNEPNGAVYIEAEGDARVLKQFVEWCKTGSPAAAVSSVKVDEQPVRGYTDFQIKT